MHKKWRNVRVTVVFLVPFKILDLRYSLPIDWYNLIDIFYLHCHIDIFHFYILGSHLNICHSHCHTFTTIAYQFNLMYKLPDSGTLILHCHLEIICLLNCWYLGAFTFKLEIYEISLSLLNLYFKVIIL